MEKSIWKVIYLIGIILIFIWIILLIVNIIQTTKLRTEYLEYLSKQNVEENKNIDQIGWCNIQTSPDGKIKYCNDIHGWHFDFCNGRDFYIWVCSTKKDVEENKTLYENICISVRNTCSEGYVCEPDVSPISCQKS